MESIKGLKKEALLKGVILGVILLVLDILMAYVIAYSASLMSIIAACLFAFLIIPLVFLIIFIKKIRAKIGGFWNLRQATSAIFILLFSAHLLSSAGSLVFISSQPQLSVQVKDNFIHVFSTFMEKLKADQDQVDEFTEQIEAKFSQAEKATVKSMVFGLLFSIIKFFIASLILAAIFKKEHPENAITPV